MTKDPLYRYIRLQMPHGHRHDQHRPVVPTVFEPDSLNRHYDDRRTWLAWRDVPPERTAMRTRLGRVLVRFGRWVEGQGPESALEAGAR